MTAQLQRVTAAGCVCGGGGLCLSVALAWRSFNLSARPSVHCAVASHQTTFVPLIHTVLQEVEIAVVLLYELGEGAPEEALKADSGALGQLALALMQVCVGMQRDAGLWPEPRPGAL